VGWANADKRSGSTERIAIEAFAAEHNALWFEQNRKVRPGEHAPPMITSLSRTSAGRNSSSQID
jgi:hypothetical protein